MNRLEFGVCRNCGHSIVNYDSKWLHHITRSKLLGYTHWPAGHVITVDCKWKGCECKNPEQDQSMPLKTRMVYLGKTIDQ